MPPELGSLALPHSLSGNDGGNVLRRATGLLRKSVSAAVCFGFVLNIIQLGLPIYTMQVFDRVVPSGHLATLAALTILLGFATICSAFVDVSRSLLLSACSSRIGLLFDRAVSLHTLIEGRETVTLRDVDLVRNFLAGPSLLALSDLPWTLVYMAALFYIHPILGIYTVSCFTALIGSALVARYLVSSAEAASYDSSRAFNHQLASLTQQSSDFGATGVTPGLLNDFFLARNNTIRTQRTLQGKQAWIDGVTRANRSGMQIAVLALAAVLVVLQDVNAGAIVASSMLFSRAVAPVERLSANLAILRATERSWRKLRAFFRNKPPQGSRVKVPQILGEVKIEGVSVSALPRSRPALDTVTLELKAGNLHVVVGAEGSGKTALLHLIAGAHQPTKGTVKLDGMEYRNYDLGQLSCAIGYLRQNVVFRSIPIANIICKGSDIDETAMFEATKLAGVDQIVRQLPNGYGTLLSSNSLQLSTGESRRIALASAIYRTPQLLLLDEPMSGLDENGEHDVINIIRHFRELQHTVVVVSKSAQLLHLADELIFLDKGRVKGITSGEALRTRIGPRSLAT